jgi:PKD repeat protein
MRTPLFIFVFLLLFASSAIAQSLTLYGELAQESSLLIDEALQRYEVVKLKDPELRSGGAAFQSVHLQWGQMDFSAPVAAFDRQIHEVMVQDAEGGVSQSTLRVWRGQNARGETVNLALNDGFIMGEFTQKGKTWIIEQARNFDAAFSTDYLVIYQPEDVRGKEVQCGVGEDEALPATAIEKAAQSNLQEIPLSACRTIEYAIAADHTSFLRHGGLQQTANYILGIMNLVGANYVGVFNDDFQYKINQILVYTSLASNPWTPTNDIAVHLNNFFDAAPGIFSRPFDICSYWFSTTGFSSGTVGLAYLNFTCNSRGSNAIREYGASANSMRVLVAHEIGHNLSATHDATTGFIMSPSVNNTNTWSTQSTNQINNWMAGNNAKCFTACAHAACESELVGGVSMVYDTTANHIRVRWTQIPNETVRIRWFSKALNKWDSVTASNLNGAFNINTPCANGREYRVEIMKQCSGGLFAINSASWVLTAAHQPQIDFGNSLSFCTGTTKQLVSLYQHNGHQYRWFRSGTLLAGQNNPSLNITTGGNYRLEVNNGNGCWFSSPEVSIFSSDKPVAKFGYQFISPTQVRFTDSSVLAESYLWQFDNGESSSLKSPPLQQYITNGVKTISLTTTGCGGQHTATSQILIAVDALYQNINRWGTHTGIVYEGAECASRGRFSAAANSRHSLLVNSQFPAEGTMEWRGFFQKGYNTANPAETNIIYLAGSMFSNAVSGRFSIHLNMGLQQLLVRVLNGNTQTNFTASLSQSGMELNKWVLIGLSYGSMGLQVRINDRLYTWGTNSSIFTLGGPAVINGQNNHVSTGHHFNAHANAMVGFEGVISGIRVSQRQRDFQLQHPISFIPSAVSGNWTTASTWNLRSGAIPQPCDSVVILTGHEVSVGAAAFARHVHVNQGGVLRLNSPAASLQIGLSGFRSFGLVSRGTVNLSQGFLGVKGFVNLEGGTFQMNANTTLHIDGNTGQAGTSIPDGVHLFRAAPALSSFALQGTLHIVNPPFGGNSQAISCSYNFGDNSTIKFGDAISTISSNNANGFGGNLFPARIGKLIIDTKTTSGNRHFINLNPISAKSPVQVLSGELIQKAHFEVRQ